MAATGEVEEAVAADLAAAEVRGHHRHERGSFPDNSIGGSRGGFGGGDRGGRGGARGGTTFPCTLSDGIQTNSVTGARGRGGDRGRGRGGARGGGTMRSFSLSFILLHSPSLSSIF